MIKLSGLPLKKTLYVLILMLPLAMLGVSACQQDEVDENPEFKAATTTLKQWQALLLQLEQQTPGYRPPVSGRMFAYVQMAAYEASLPALPQHYSLSRYLKGYQAPDFPRGQPFQLNSALSAAFGQILRNFFPTAPAPLLAEIDKIEHSVQNLPVSKAQVSAFESSFAFGKAVAASVWQFSMLDTCGHDGFMYNYDKHFKPCKSPGCWQPESDRAMPALLPYWGACRTLLLNPDSLFIHPPAVFSEQTHSAFYANAMEVFSVSQSLTEEDKWIAEFWSDDLPGFTITPVGRWFSIAGQAFECVDAKYVWMLETYLRLGLAMCDAGIICWRQKYQYQMERPESYIRRNIHPDWKSLHPNPPFPAYPSGHAVFGSAAAAVLSVAFGSSFEITDRTHHGRKEFAGKARSFPSFEAMARENAYSRVLLGVHYRMDCDEGMRLGEVIGKKILELPLSKKKVALNGD